MRNRGPIPSALPQNCTGSHGGGGGEPEAQNHVGAHLWQPPGEPRRETGGNRQAARPGQARSRGRRQWGQDTRTRGQGRPSWPPAETGKLEEGAGREDEPHRAGPAGQVGGSEGPPGQPAVGRGSGRGGPRAGRASAPAGQGRGSPRTQGAASGVFTTPPMFKAGRKAGFRK